jgi:hypothetical protein
LKLAYAIQTYEGYSNNYRGTGAATRSYRNNNPGNLRSSPFSDITEGGFAVFNSYYHGLYALLWDLQAKCLGHTTTGLGPESKLFDLFRIYAPSIENDPAAYHAFVTSSLGLDPEIKLWEILNG